MLPCIITISREFCTGGHHIARQLADTLGLPYYDKELITLAAKESGLSEEAVRQSENKRTGSLLYSLYSMSQELPLTDQVYLAQSKVIRELADQGPCVIVGRCADYVLRERTDCLQVFIHAGMDFRRARLHSQHPELREQELDARIAKEDKKRASYYNYYTQRRWGSAGHYHITLDASLGQDVCVQILTQAARAFAQNQKVGS